MLPERWGHQQKELVDNLNKPKLMLLWEMRCGKSRASLDFLLHHISSKRALECPRRAIIACPLVVAPQWASLVSTVLEDAKESISVYNAYEKPTAKISLWIKANPEGVIIINDDKLPRLIDNLLKWGPSVFIGDESHRYRGAATARGKAARKLSWASKYVRLLTGTPTPNNMGNLWGQMVCVNKELWGSSFSKFANKFLIRDSMFPSKILGVLHKDKLREMILSCSSIVRRADVFGPDQYQFVVKDIDLPSKAKTLYKDLVKKWVTEDALGYNETIDLTHKLKRITRLQQLTSGFIKDEDGEIHQIHSAKYDLVMNDVEEVLESGQKVVVFHRFTEEGDRLYAGCKQRFGVGRVFRLSGQISGEERNKAITNFELCSTGGAFIVQTQSGGIGVSFATALYAFFVSQSFNADHEQQARDRIYAPGCGRCITYYRALGTVDNFIAGILESKEVLAEAVKNSSIEDIAYNITVVKAEKGMI